MAIESSRDGHDTRLRISGPLTIAEALAAYDQLALAFSTSSHIDLDLAEVTEIDCAGLQLLLVSLREVVPVTVLGVSPPLQDLLKHLNLLEAFGLELRHGP